MKFRGFARLALMVIPVAGAAAPMTLSHLAKAAGATIIVGTTDDPSSGTDCSASTGSGTSACSLRAAVLQANLDNAGDIIQLGAHTYFAHDQRCLWRRRQRHPWATSRRSRI